jgi:hypothetical protein
MSAAIESGYEAAENGTKGGTAMGFYGQAEAAAQKIVRLFEDTSSLPRPLAQVFIRRKDRPHC